MTHRLTDDEIALLQKPERKLSVIPPGHWRVVFTMAANCMFIPYDADLLSKDAVGTETWRGWLKYVSRDVAETKGRKRCAVLTKKLNAAVEFVRAEFFPGEPA